MFRRLLLILALAAPLATAGEARAQEGASLPEGGLVEILPLAEVIGDGATKVEVPVLVLDRAGAPVAGLTLSPRASAGTVSGWRSVSPGIYAFDLVPPAVTQPTKLTLTASGKVPGRGTFAAELTVDVTPGVGGVTATAKPGALVLGKADGAALLVDAPRGVRLRASAGEITDLTDLGAKKTARYVPPKVNIPQVAIVAAADEVEPGRIVGWTTLRLDGAVDFPVTVAPNASVKLKIGDQTFGPVVAGADGKAAVPIVVPPGVGEGTLVATVDGRTTESALDLKIPPQKRLLLAPLPGVVPADSAIEIPLRALVVRPDGAPDHAAKPTFTASSGTVGAARHEGDGVYVATWTPADADVAGAASITVKLDGSAVDVDTIEVRTAPRRVAKLTVVAPTDAPADGSVTLVVQAEGGGGPITGRTPTATATGATITGVSERGEGAYAIALARSGDEPLDVDVVVAPDPTDNPLRHVVVLPGTERLANDGEAGTTVTIATVDALGYPVPGIEVALRVEAGGGALAERTVSTDEHGLATVEYTAGTSVGLARLRATAGSATGAAAIVQAPRPVGPEDLPIGGTASAVAVDRAWADSVLEWRPSAPPSAAIALAPEDAATKALEVVAEPVAVRPGSVALVRITPRDADGRPIPGQAGGLDLLTSAGTFGAVTEQDGTYTAPLTIPADAAGEIKVSVIAPSGVMQLVKLTADPDAPVLALVGPSAPEVAPEPVAARAPREPGARPWVRVGLAGLGSVYRYEQAPSADPGPLLPQTLSVGRRGGGTPAKPAGGEIDARGWLPDLPYVGFHGLLRASRYAIEVPAFDETVPDTLLNLQLAVTGRYPFAIGPDQFWIGAKAGFHYADFVIFKGCLDPGCTGSFEALRLPGIGVGAEMGAEVSDLFFVAGYTQGLAYGSVAYASAVDVDVGYQIVPNAFANVGFTASNRRIVVNGADSGLERGSLDDAQTIFTVGGGVSF